MGVHLLSFLKPRRRLQREPRPETLPTALHGQGLSFAQWWKRRASKRRLCSDLDSSLVEQIRKSFPELAADTIRAADQLLDHRFQLLGSGPYTPHDTTRPTSADGYRPIDWYLDPVCNLRFPERVPYKQWNLMQMRPGSADVKLPWELARCQHWPTLGQAYRLTGNDRYAREILRQCTDFVEANPPGLGIHWTCTMDVAIRALNWAIALEMIRACPAIELTEWEAAYTALFEHGIFISRNLENHYEVTSNHYLSNMVGLYYVAAVFDDLAPAAKWDRDCRESFEREIGIQVLDDGADFESSVPYHRLVTELFLGAGRLAQFRRRPLSREYTDRLSRMVDYLVGVLRPDGKMPQIGDADDGRLHIFTRYGTWQPQDPRHVLAPAAHFLSRPEWLDLAGGEGSWEAAWWGYAPATARERVSHPRLKIYPHAGVAVARHEQLYLLITNSVVGTRGFGNHKHNDQLSFEFHAAGVPWIVDPGSYVYTSDPTARNQFRGTAYHNTLCIDETEQNELKPEWLFRMIEAARAEHVRFADSRGCVEYAGRHHGYERLGNPVTHERRFRLDLQSGCLRIDDLLSGTGRHRCHWHFHLDPAARAVRHDKRVFRLQVEDVRYELIVPDGLSGQIGQGWYSPSYGVRRACSVIDLETTVELHEKAEWSFTLEPRP